MTDTLILFKPLADFGEALKKECPKNDCTSYLYTYEQYCAIYADYKRIKETIADLSEAADAQGLGRFLRSLPVLEAPWDTEFQKRYCSGCVAENCDACPNERFRNNPEWWLSLEADSGVAL